MYILAQVLTGIEGGIIVTILHVFYGYQIPVATAIIVPILYPVLIIQMISIYLVLNKLGKQPKENTIN